MSERLTVAKERGMTCIYTCICRSSMMHELIASLTASSTSPMSAHRLLWPTLCSVLGFLVCSSFTASPVASTASSRSRMEKRLVQLTEKTQQLEAAREDDAHSARSITDDAISSIQVYAYSVCCAVLYCAALCDVVWCGVMWCDTVETLRRLCDAATVVRWYSDCNAGRRWFRFTLCVKRSI